MSSKYIYKILHSEELRKAKSLEVYSGSSKDIEDGFIHFSNKDQVEGTLKKYYTNQKDLILLKVDTSKLDQLIWEKASNGNLFPHLYSKLKFSNIVGEFEITQLENGSHKLPDSF